MSICFSDRRPDLVILAEILSNNTELSKYKGEGLFDPSVFSVVLWRFCEQDLDSAGEIVEASSHVEAFTSFTLWVCHVSAELKHDLSTAQCLGRQLKVLVSLRSRNNVIVVCFYHKITHEYVKLNAAC